jgi:hypothetical protein
MTEDKVDALLWTVARLARWQTYGRLFNKAEAAQERWIALERDYLRRHYPGTCRNENSAQS